MLIIDEVISSFLQVDETVFDLEEAGLCYVPQSGATKDSVNLAGMIAVNHLRGNHPLAKWELLLELHVQQTEEYDGVDQVLSLIMNDLFLGSISRFSYRG